MCAATPHGPPPHVSAKIFFFSFLCVDKCSISLEICKRYNIVYTFFLTGVSLSVNSALSSRIIDGENARGRVKSSDNIDGRGGSNEHELNNNKIDTWMAMKENIF